MPRNAHKSLTYRMQPPKTLRKIQPTPSHKPKLYDFPQSGYNAEVIGCDQNIYVAASVTVYILLTVSRNFSGLRNNPTGCVPVALNSRGSISSLFSIKAVHCNELQESNPTKLPQTLET